ncbi:MAG TPA: alpha/beta fold hydrolase [bacterium]|nr:alpha/beta fold hydrolase [bacterium]
MKRAAMIGVLCAMLLTVAACKVKVGPGDTAWQESVRAHRHDADLGGFTLHYIDLGQGEPVVMIHGFADSTYCWHENIAPLLNAGKRLILVDQPGMGNSGLPPEPYRYAVENQAGEILKLLDQLNVERFALVGSSMGGGIALYLSLTRPQRVTRAVVIDPTTFPPHDSPALAEPGMEPLVKIFGGRLMFRAALRQVYYDRSKVDEVLVDEYVHYANKDGYARALTALGRDFFSPEFVRMSERYGELQTPVLAIWGLRDKWVPPAQGVRLAAQAPRCRLELIPDVGHLPHQELPAAVNPLLVEGLSD